jgi:hypothetical protein
MWTGLPDLNALLLPVLTWAIMAVAMIAARILIWSIYENWSQNPDRFSWFAALFKALGVGLVAVVAFNAATIIGFFIGTADGTAP